MAYRLYFDTSALIKEFVDEVGSDLINKLLVSSESKNIQIISSVWSINEAIGVIDRLSRTIDTETKMPKLSNIDIQQIIATFVERVIRSGQNSLFSFVPINHSQVAGSRLLIRDYHITPNDALQIFTGYSHNCDYFLIHDKKVTSRMSQYQKMKIIDLGNEKDRLFLETQLKL